LNRRDAPGAQEGPVGATSVAHPTLITGMPSIEARGRLKSPLQAHPTLITERQKTRRACAGRVFYRL